MDFRKIFAELLLSAVFAIPVQAEQPAAQEYRNMLQSGTFYVEYSIRDYDTSRKFPEWAKHDRRKPGVEDSGEVMWGWGAGSSLMGGQSMAFVGTGMPIGTGVTYAVANEGKDRIQNLKKIVKKGGFGVPLPFVNVEVGGSQKAYFAPRLMYRQGKYYRFTAGTYWGGNSWLQSGKEVKNNQAIVLAESDMNSPDIDTSEGWESIRGELALPYEFAVFNLQDSYWDTQRKAQCPVFKESGQRTIGKDTYECDLYTNKENDNLTGKVSDFVYYALYKEGKLSLLQKYRVLADGSEEISEEIYVRNMTGQLPENAFTFVKPVPVYAAGIGDVNDFLGIPVQVGTLGGNTDGK